MANGHSLSCAMCGSKNIELAGTGELAQHRCSACGWQWAPRVTLRPVPDRRKGERVEYTIDLQAKKGTGTD